MGRKQGSLLGDLFEIASLLPWWVGFLLAVASYFLLHYFALQEVAQANDMKNAGDMAFAQMFKTLAFLGQFVLPLVFVAGAILSYVGKARRSKLFAQVRARAETNSLLELNWRDFERLVGEAFRRRGYSVIENDAPGADGGVDLVLTKGGEKLLVQCKRWKATMVGVDVVRELFGVMAARGAVGGFVITSGCFSPDARAFVEGRNIELIAGDKLLAMIQEVQRSDIGTNPSIQTTGNPVCRTCGSAMVRRIAKKGSNAGSAFWGCSAYPRCKGTRSIE